MPRLLAEYGFEGNLLAFHAFVKAMNIERPHSMRAEESTTRLLCNTDLPPSQAGLAAALRRAFTPPADVAAQPFDDLLRKLDGVANHVPG
jgi:hypothetical protein